MTLPVMNTGTNTPTPPDEKPFWTTSEFYVTAVAPLIIAFLTLFNVGHVDLTRDARAQAMVKIGALIAAAIAAGFYAHSRGKVKASSAVKQTVETLVQLLPTITSMMAERPPAQITLNATSAELASNRPESVELAAAVPADFTNSQLEQLGGFFARILDSRLERVVSAVDEMENRLNEPVVATFQPARRPTTGAKPSASS